MGPCDPGAFDSKMINGRQRRRNRVGTPNPKPSERPRSRALMHLRRLMHASGCASPFQYATTRALGDEQTGGQDMGPAFTTGGGLLVGLARLAPAAETRHQPSPTPDLGTQCASPTFAPVTPLGHSTPTGLTTPCTSPTTGATPAKSLWTTGGTPSRPVRSTKRKGAPSTAASSSPTKCMSTRVLAYVRASVADGHGISSTSSMTASTSQTWRTGRQCNARQASACSRARSRPADLNRSRSTGSSQSGRRAVTTSGCQPMIEL